MSLEGEGCTNPASLVSSDARRPRMQRSNTNFQYNHETHRFNVQVSENEQTIWKKVLIERFPKSLNEKLFVNETYRILGLFGFQNSNTLSCVSVCRDELCSQLSDLLDNAWKSPYLDIQNEQQKIAETQYTHSFVMSSLAGMLFLGQTGFRAALSHSPTDADGKRRYVFFAFPHIGICDNGILGRVDRPGQPEPSSACGALLHFHDELGNGYLNLATDPDDIEYSILKQKMLKKIRLFGNTEPPSIFDLTNTAHQTILEDLEKLISNCIDATVCDYAVVTGIQIHTPGGVSFILPKTTYAVTSGTKHLFCL